MHRPEKSARAVSQDNAEFQPLEARRLMAATVALPFRLDFGSVVSGTVVDKDGQGTGFGAVRAGASSQIDVNAAKGTLAMTADYAAGKATSALETAFDGTTRGFTISTRLNGPLTQLVKSGDMAGVYFGPDVNNCVRLTAVNMSGEKLQLATIVNGQYVGDGNATYLTLPVKFSQIGTLDLQLTGDSVTGQVTGYYVINGKKTTRINVQTVPSAKKAAFFNGASEAGLIVQDKRGPITATFDSFAINAGTVARVPAATMSRAQAVFSDLTTTSNSSAPQTVRVVNTGEGDLVIDSAQITGANNAEFTITNRPTKPVTLKPGQKFDFYVTFKTTTAGSVRNATLTLATNDPAGNPTVALRGLGLAGAGGAFEPALQKIIDLYGFKTSTGQGTASNAFDSNVWGQDQVTAPRLVKAGSGPVTVEILGTFANQVSRTTFGWYEAGNPQSLNAVGTVSADNAQSLSPLGDGQLSFDPGSGAFGLYGNFTLGSTTKPLNRNVYSEDALNTWETNGAKQKKVRLYALRDGDGNVVANSYVVTFEEYNVTFDQNDIVAIVRNVQPAATGAEIGLENLDNAPFADRLVMSRVRTPDKNLANEFHDTGVLRVRNTGNQPLVISDMVLSNADFEIVSGGGAQTLAPGASADVKIKFVYNDSSNGHKLRTATLTVKSNDGDEATKVVTLAGLWQSHSENQPNGVSAEPTAEMIVQAFGYSTKLVSPGQKFDTKGFATPVGDETMSELWQKADKGLPVTVRMLATYHQQYDVVWNTHSTFYTYDPTKLDAAKGKPTLTKQFAHNQLDSQSVLPRLDGSTTATAQASFTPGSEVFGFNIDGYNSTFSEDKWNTPNDASNPGHGWRFYVAKDAKGNVIPDTWIAAQDYVKVGWANYDYQDNILLISNVRPVSQPQTVANVKAVGLTQGVGVSWAANTAADVTAYNVYRRATDETGDYEKVATVPGTAYADTNTTAGKSYDYVVTAATYQGGESQQSPVVSAVADSGKVNAPAAPTTAVAVAVSANGVKINWNDSGSNETAFRVERKTGTGAWTGVGTVNANVLTFTDGTVSATTTYSYRVIATNAAGDSPASNETAVTTPAVTPSTPQALTGIDIGNPKPAGVVTTVTAAKDYDVSVGGADIYGTSDSFNFLYGQKTGDFDVSVKVSNLTAVDPSSQAGLMVRESLAANAKNVNVKAKAEGLRLTYRAATGGASAATGTGAFAGSVYLRLQRTGNLFTTYTSADGKSWKVFGTATVSMGSTVYVGLATCGKSTTAAAIASYRGYGDTGTVGTTPPDVGTTPTTPTTPPAVGTTLLASADTYVYDGAATSNYGSAPAMQVKKSSAGYNRQGLVGFDISNVTTANSVKLRLLAGLNTPDSVQVALYGVTGAWTDGGTTWATKPATGGLLGTFVADSTAGKWVEVDVTAYVKSAVAAGQTSVSFSLQGTGGSTAFVTIATRDSGANGPQLSIA